MTLVRLAVLAVVSAVLSAATWINQHPYVQAAVCPPLTDVPGRFLICDVQHELVSDAEAAQTLREYYRSATAARASLAWSMLAPNVQAEYPSKESYSAEVSERLWGELQGAPVRQLRGAGFLEEDRTNQFLVTVRLFEVDGEVRPMQYLVRLRRQAEARTLITEHVLKGFAPGATEQEATATLRSATDGHEAPWRDSGIAWPASDQRPTGGRVRVLCEIEVPAEHPRAQPADAGWWALTNHGWFQVADMEAEDDRLGILQCDPYVLMI